MAAAAASRRRRSERKQEKKEKISCYAASAPPRGMPRASDPAWAAHTKEVTKEETKAGIVVTIKGWTCTYCSKDFWNRNLFRLLAHLCGDRELCKEGELCSEATKPISATTKETCVAKLTLKSTKRTEKRAREEESHEAESVGDNERAEKVQSRIKTKTVDACKVDGALSDLFDGLGIAHNKVNHPLFKRFFSAAMNAPPDYKLPSDRTLGGTIMDQQYQANLDERSDALKHEGVRKFGMTGTTDGATIQKSPLLNFLFMCVVWPVALLLKCHDCTQHLATGASKNAEYITELMISVIRSLPYPRYVDLIITDGAGDMSKFRRLLTAVFSWIHTIWCVSHICNCILKHAAANSKIESLIDKGKAIVDRFGGSKHFEHSLFTVKSKGVTLIRYCDTRFGLYFLMLHRLFMLRMVLKSCVSSEEYQGVYGSADDDVADIILDTSFWDDVELLIKVAWPLMMLLRLGDMRQPTLHLLYKAALLVKERLEKYQHGADSELASEFAAAFDDSLGQYFDELTSDLAKAASLGDVQSWATGTLKNKPECKAKFNEYLASYVEQYEESEEFENKASAQLLAYLNMEGIFGTAALRKDARKMSARAFWDKHDGHAPELSAVMLHLVSKVTGSGEAERNWKDTKFIYSKARNRLKKDKREKLIARYNILAQRYGLLDADEVDPAEESAKYGALRLELEDPEVSNADDDADTTVRDNILKPYFEDSEEARLTTKESDDDTARFWLLQKYKGAVFVDEDTDPPEYRKIVDLEWNVKKPEGWKRTGAPAGSFPWRQWKVVGDLLPEKHQALIDKLVAEADEDDENPTLEAYFINSLLFDMIKAVPEDLQLRKIELEDCDEMEDDDEEDEDDDEEDEDDDEDEED